MSFTTSISFSDNINSLSYSKKKPLSEIEVVCFDTRNIPEIPTMISENLFKTLNLPLRCNNYELVAISFIVSARNLSTGKVFGTSLDPCITFPRTNESVMLDSTAFHPLVLDDQNFVNFTEELF